MSAVIIGLILIVAIAVAIMVVVAAPRLRQGDELLTPESKMSIQRAGQAAREQSAAAAENTVSAVSNLREKVSSAWSPASDFLHQQFDRLEGETDPSGTPRITVDAESHNPEPKSGSAVVGGPRPIPAESGPIPIDTTDRSASSSHPDEMTPQSAISPDTNRRLY